MGGRGAFGGTAANLEVSGMFCMPLNRNLAYNTQTTVCSFVFGVGVKFSVLFGPLCIVGAAMTGI